MLLSFSRGDTMKVEPKVVMMEIRLCHIIRIRFQFKGGDERTC